MNDEITKRQDQTLVVSGTSVDLFGVVDQIIASSIKQHDPRAALSAAATLRKWGKISGVVLAKLLFEVREAWDSFDTDDEFIDMVETVGDVDKQTARKYTSIWGNVILGCPENLRSFFESMPMETLWLIAPAAKDGDLGTEDWEKLSRCVNKSEVREIIRAIRGKQTSSDNALILTVKRDGTLVARKGDEMDHFGFLNLDKESKVAQSAIDRLIRGAGLVQE